MPTEPSETEKWRRFDLLLANFQAIGKWQSRFVNALIAFICLVWVVDLLHSSGGITVQLLGATVQIQGLWQIVPLVTGILSRTIRSIDIANWMKSLDSTR